MLLVPSKPGVARPDTGFFPNNIGLLNLVPRLCCATTVTLVGLAVYALRLDAQVAVTLIFFLAACMTVVQMSHVCGVSGRVRHAS